jgi:hypothetical protein
VNKNFHTTTIQERKSEKASELYKSTNKICNILEKKANILGMQSGLVNEIEKG